MTQLLGTGTSSSTGSELPKRIQKRQSQGNRYASDFQGNRHNREQYNSNPYGGNEFAQNGPNQGGHFEFIPSISLDVGRQGVSDDSQNQNTGRGTDFEFGPPPDFGRNDGHNSPGFEFDFSIPKEFQQELGQSDTSNTDHRPIYSGHEEFGNEYDVGYDDYVKKHFPEAFGSTRPPTAAGHQGPIGMTFLKSKI